MKRFSVIVIVSFLFLTTQCSDDNTQGSGLTVWKTEGSHQGSTGSQDGPSTTAWSTTASTQSSSSGGQTPAWHVTEERQPSGSPQTSAWHTSSTPQPSSNGAQTPAWHTQKQGPKQTVTTSAWHVTSEAEIGTTIYNTNAYSSVSQNLYSLQERLGAIIQFYEQESLLQQTSWSGSIQVSKKALAKYQKYFTEYLQDVAGNQDSYLSAVRGIFQGYQELPAMYQKKLQQTKEKNTDANAATYFAKMPFRKGSFALELVQEATGSILSYIRMRMELISVDTYASNATQAFLVGSPSSPSQFAQLHHAVDIFEGICEQQFAQLKGMRGISKEELAELENNYTSIFTAYEEATSNLLIVFTLKLLKEISTKYPLDLAIHADVTAMNVNLPVLKELYGFSKAGLEVLEEVAKKKKGQEHRGESREESSRTISAKTYFGLYDSPKAVLEALGLMMAQILSFAGTVEQNLIAQQIKEKNLQSNIPAIQKAMSTASLLYLQAAGCYYDAQNMTNYSAYGLIGKSLSMAAQSWIKAQRNDHSGTYGYAAEQYQLAYEAAQQTGSSSLGFLLLRFYNMAMLNYAQYSLNQYAHFGEYQSDIVNYVRSAATIPEGIKDSQESLIQNLFYSEGSTAFKGIGGLCSQVAESYKANLSSLQATKHSMQNNKKLLLQNGITVTQNVADGAKAMLIGTPATGDEPIQAAADTSMYVKYYDPQSVFYGQQRYLDVFHSFQLADKAMEQAPNNQYAPLGALFKDSPIKTFSGFAQLHFTRICLMSAIEARAYITNPKYAYYKNACIVSSFLSFLSAYKVYKVLGDYSHLVEYCGHELEEFRSVLPVILKDAQNRINNPKATQLDYQMALAETQGATMLGSEQAAQLYQQLIQQYVKKAGAGDFGTQFPAVLQAYTYYQAYLWSLHQRNQNNAQMYQQKMTQALKELMEQIERARSFVVNDGESFDKRIAMQEQLKDLQKTLEQYSTTQHYEQALFGIEKNDFCQVQNVESVKGSAILQIEIVFMSGIKKTLLNPLYQLARLYVAQSDSELQELEQNFNSSSPNYGLLTTSRFKSLMTNYKTALVSFGQLGLENQVMKVEQAMTQTAAFRYFSAVIPSDIVTKNITVSRKAIINRGTAQFQSSGKKTGTGAWHVSSVQSQEQGTTAWNVSSSQPQGQGQNTTAWNVQNQGGQGEQEREPQVKKPSILPYYLIADWEVNITKLATDASNIAQQASQQAAEGTRIPPAMEQKQKLYNEILTTAQRLRGKKESLDDIVKYVAVPLFKDQLQTGGYQGVFKTLDQEVDLYYDQVMYLAMRGMQVGNSTLKATLNITTQADPTTGEEDIIIRGTNLPLAPIPRYRGDTNCAVFYYSLYQKFFNQTGQPVDVGGSIFFPITGQQAIDKGERGQRETDRAYLASSLQYKHKIAYLIAPLQRMTSDDRFNADFKTYSKIYTQLTKAYQWQDALIAAIGMLQKKVGLGYVNVNEKSSELYKNWAEDCKLFLFGAPFAPSYLQVLNNIQGYYDLAAQLSTNASTKSDLYKRAAQLNIDAAEKCVQLEQIVPQIDGYPSTSPSGFPTGSTTVGSKALKTLKCGSAPKYTFPSGESITWKYYEDAQMHYSEALKLYKKALAAENSHQTESTALENALVRSLTGLSLKSHVLASLQRATIIARNVWTVTTEEKSHVEGDTVDVNAAFAKIRKDGASGGGISAASGLQSLVSGSGKQSSGNAVEQYVLMKKMMLDAIIYMIPLMGSTENIVKELSKTSPLSEGQVKTTVPAISGSAVICAAANNVPNLGAIAVSKKGSKHAAIVNITAFNSVPGDVNLNSSLTATSKITLLYADTFPSFVEYAMNDLIGNIDNKFARIDNTSQVAALSTFAGQLYGLLTNLYKQTFMPELMKHQDDKANIEKAETSFQTALKAAQQKMLVNATGYLG